MVSKSPDVSSAELINRPKLVRSSQTKPRRAWRSIAIFLGPAILLYTTFTLFPVFMTLFNSVHELDMTQNLARTFVGLQNFKDLLTNDLIINDAFRNSITWAVVAPFFDVGLGFALALLLYWKPPGANFFRTVWYIPVLFSWVVIGVLTRWIYNYDWGPIVLALRGVGLDSLAVNFLGTLPPIDPDSWRAYLPLLLLIPAVWLLTRAIQGRKPNQAILAIILSALSILLVQFPAKVVNVPLYSLIAMTVWKFTGWNMVIFLAALSSLPSELLDAARIDGADNWQVLRHIIFPLLRVLIVNLYILSWIGKMMQFALVWVTTKGGPLYFTETVATYVQKRAFSWRTLDLGYPSAIAVLWFLIVFASALIFNRFLKTQETYEF